MMMADNHEHLKQYGKAEAHYRTASLMCPAKFIPLYKLFQLYHMRGEDKKAQSVAQRIIRKQVKVPSAEILTIRHEMRNYLHK
jgi:hypothetical protein